MPATPDAGRPLTLLAFDYGTRRIGVAVGQDVTGSASPLGVVAVNDGDYDRARLAALIGEWQPDRLVVGLPTHADGSRSPMSERAEAFCASLRGFGLPVDVVDERYSSLEAGEGLKAARRSGARGRITRADVDSASAVVIAERWLARHRR